MLSNEAIEEFRQIYKNIFKEDITFEQAREQGVQLVEVFKVICKPVKKYAK